MRQNNLEMRVWTKACTLDDVLKKWELEKNLLTLPINVKKHPVGGGVDKVEDRKDVEEEAVTSSGGCSYGAL